MRNQTFRILGEAPQVPRPKERRLLPHEGPQKIPYKKGKSLPSRPRCPERGKRKH